MAKIENLQLVIPFKEDAATHYMANGNNMRASNVAGKIPGAGKTGSIDLNIDSFDWLPSTKARIGVGIGEAALTPAASFQLQPEDARSEQHVRAVCGLPLGDTSLLAGRAAMVNLLGDLWAKAEPKWARLKDIPGSTVHLYGKADARPGRKMGHYTVVGAAAEAEFDRADQRLQELRG